MTDNLRAETINSLSWSFLESLAARGLRFIVGIILARLLFPEQFGLIGMLMIFMAVARVFVESGYGAALIQKREATQADICSIFYFNILLGFLTAGLLCLAAPWIGEFYHQPILTPLVRALSLAIPIDALGLIQEILLAREINFRAHAIRSLVAGVLAGGIGVGCAFAGFGVWSLVAQQLSESFFRTICLWVLSRWRPQLIFSFGSLRRMFGFGSSMLFSGLLNQVFDNVYYTVIGKLFSAADLGLFTRARALQSWPSQSLSEVVGRVTFPVFSKSQDDKARLKRGLRKALTVIVLINFPLMVGLAVTAQPLVIALIGPKWSGCVPYLRMFCVIGLLYPLQAVNLNVLKSLGRSDLILRLATMEKILIAANIAITMRWGIPGIIYGMIATSAVSFYLNSYYTRILVDYSALEQLRDLLPYLAVAALMGIITFLVGLLPFPGNFVMLLVQIPVGAITYLGLCWIIRLSAFVEVRNELCNRIPFFRARIIA